MPDSTDKLQTGDAVTLPSGYEGEFKRMLGEPRLSVVEVVSACGRYAAVMCRQGSTGKVRRNLLEVTKLKKHKGFKASRSFAAFKDHTSKCSDSGWYVQPVKPLPK